jgi:hypothetical protein
LSTPSRRKVRPPAAVPEPSRSELRNEEARAALKPLAPGEWPIGLRVAIAVSMALALGNLIAFALGAKIGGKHPGAGVLSFSVLTGMMAAGMWLRRYWAVLAFEALLTIIIIVFSLFLVEASNVEALVLCVGVIGAGGWLFWKLVRVMSRLAAPRDAEA